MSYFGGKGGVFRTLINQIPPHEVYIEPFLGGGAIMLNKKPARENIGIDLNSDVINNIAFCFVPNLTLKTEDALHVFGYWDVFNYKNVFLYCDPPYILSTRKGGPEYKFEFSDDQHKELLQLLASLKCMVMVSGYRHAIYDDALGDWRRIDYKAPTRHGLVNESAWMNYPEPTELHDYRYLGRDFREREKITRQQKRWIKRLKAMPVLQRKAIQAALLDMEGEAS